ncbi:MAG: hypothetical protein AAF125_18565, partial [Chloroflexota bacterium]
IPRLSWLMTLGSVMIVTGGLMKATWKLVMATSGTDIVWLSESLFLLMAPGFLFVAVTAWASMHAVSGKTVPIWLLGLPLLVVILVLVVADVRTMVQGIERGWFFPFLLLASVSNVALAAMLITGAARRGKWLAVFLLSLNIGMVFALQPLAAMDDMSIAMHWIEQTLTIAGAAAFAGGAYLMLDVMVTEARQVVLRMAPA